MSAEPYNLLPFSSVSAREDELARRLTPRQLGVIVSGGAIGTGLFPGSSIAVRLAGPGAYRDDAYGFLNGTPRTPALYAATPGLDIARGPAVLQELLRRNVLVDYRLQAGLRASPTSTTPRRRLTAWQRRLPLSSLLPEPHRGKVSRALLRELECRYSHSSTAEVSR